jgi:uncharacterized protein (TIGR04376 family)
MSVFDDFSRFLETRLEEFMRENPHLELMAMEDQLYQQQQEVVNLLGSLRLKEKRLQDEIVATAQEVQRWHERIEKAKKAERWDLAKPAEEREAALLRQGNELWTEMESTKQKIQQTVELQAQIQARLQEVKSKVAEAQRARSVGSAEQTWRATGWTQASTVNRPSSADPLEQAFRTWETDDELNELKRQMGR